MSDTNMEDSQHFNEPKATPKLYISDRTGDTLGAIELCLEILPDFNFRSSEVVLVELFIDGNKRGQSLIKGSSPDWKTIFVVSEKYLRAGQRNESQVHEAGFHITHGILIRPTSSEPKSLTKIKGSTYKVLHQLTNQTLHEEGRRDNSDIAERDKTDDADNESSQEHFYDARSQFEILQHTSTAGEDLIVEDLAADEEDSRAEDLAAAAHDSPAEHGFYDARSQFENVPDTPTAEEDPITEDLAGPGGSSLDGDQRVLSPSVTGNNASITADSAEYNLNRLDRAKRVIFQDDTSSSMEPFTAPSPSSANATSPSIQDPDTDMFNDLAINTEQSDNNEESSRHKKQMQAFGTISEYLSSNKSATQHGINSDSADPDDEAAILVRNPKPLTLRRTTSTPPGSALQPDIPNDSVGNSKTKEASLNGKDDSETDEDKPAAAAPSLKKRKDPAKQKAYSANRAASGARVNGELRKRLADNDEKIGVKGAVLRLWGGKNLGDNQDINAANIRFEDVIKKQVKLHNLLIACTDADAASDLRQRLKPWVKGKIDAYESQLDAIVSAVEETTSNDLDGPKQQADDDSGEDSNDDSMLPLMNSQQRELANFLLPKDSSVRKTTEAKARESSASDHQVRSSTSPTLISGGNDTREDSDDDELPDPNDFFTSKLPRGSFVNTQPARDAGKSAERPKKKLRME